MVVQVDVRDPDDAAKMVDAVVARYGKLDILVHSAGAGIEKKLSGDDRRRVATPYRYRPVGHFLLFAGGGRHMVKNGYGRIVNLASTAGIRGGRGRTLTAPRRAGLSL